MHRRVPTEVINPARRVGTTPEESTGPEMELDIMRLELLAMGSLQEERGSNEKANINIFENGDDENIER